MTRGATRQSGATRAEVAKRRVMSVGLVTAVALGSSLAAPVALPVLAAVDLARFKHRLPLARLYAFGVCWAWLELAGVSAAGGLWLLGRKADLAAHYRLQAWWADKVMTSLRITCGLQPDVAGAEALCTGPTVLFVRHASLADSLLTAWVITDAVGMRPRVVMKRELLVDPCLDIVGNRLPNCFVDRGAADSAPELAAIASMAHGLGSGDVAVLFPEGTRANPHKRERALEAIRRSDPQRARRMESLVNLLPPRPGGAATLLGAAPDAALCVGWHVGFEGLDTFGGIIAGLGRSRTPIRIRFARVERPRIDGSGGEGGTGGGDGAGAGDGAGGGDGTGGLAPGADFVDWLDELWLGLDQRVQDLLEARR